MPISRSTGSARRRVTVSALAALAVGTGPAGLPSATAASASTNPPPSAPIVQRISGTDRYATAIAVSQARWATVGQSDPVRGQAGAVVLARGDDFPDALAGVPLAAYRHAPLLLTEPTMLASATLAEIQRILPADGNHTVYVLGGSTAVSPAIANELHRAGYQVVRYGGETRYGTALQIAELGLDNPANIILASGDTAADALVAGPYAAGQNEVAGGKPAAIVLTGTDGINNPAITDPATAAYVRGHLQEQASTIPACQKSIAAIGFPAFVALNKFVASTAPTMKMPCWVGYAGADRYETAALLEPAVGPGTNLGVASGTQFPDALSGAAYEASFQQPLLLTDPKTLPSFTAAALTSAFNRSQEFDAAPFTVTVFGGTAAVSQKVEAGIAAAAHAQIQ